MTILKRQSRRRFTSHSGVWVGMACVLTAVSGCRGDLNASSGLSSGTTAVVTPGNDAPVTTDAFKVTVGFPLGVPYKYYLHTQGAAFSSATCSVAPTALSPNNDIYCYVDAAELDLLLGGISLQLNTPPSMCPYIMVKHYSYWGLEPGVVPAGTTCTINNNLDTGVFTQSCSAGSNLSWNGAQYVCNYDYSANQGPNCCEGQYTLNTITTSSGVTTHAPPTTVKMSGKNSACLTGPAMQLQQLDSASGYPKPKPDFASSGRNLKFDISAPAALERGSNLYIANFWNPTDYQRNAAETGTFPPASGGDVPLAYQTFAGYTPQPYYEFGCVDSAYDYVARIRVLIRSWDSVAQFTAYGNPYTDPATFEPGFNSDYLIHDESEWTDFSPTHPNARWGDVFPGMKY